MDAGEGVKPEFTYSELLDAALWGGMRPSDAVKAIQALDKLVLVAARRRKYLSRKKRVSNGE